jgi:SOS-response transcriptional repressor LexA
MLNFNPSVKLTARQQEILTLIERTIATTGSPPTRAEIATELGFKSINAAEEHIARHSPEIQPLASRQRIAHQPVL